MSTSLLYHAFSIRGYEYVRTDYQGGAVIFTIRQEPKTFRCEACGSRDVRPRGEDPRAVYEPVAHTPHPSPKRERVHRPGRFTRSRFGRVRRLRRPVCNPWVNRSSETLARTNPSEDRP